MKEYGGLWGFRALIRDCWEELDKRIQFTDVINNLTSYSTNKPLSANMGRQLNTDLESAKTILTTHASDKNNPHAVTKTQVGLGNVPNVTTNNQTPTYTQSATLVNIESGEKLSVSMGKIMKGLADLIAHLSDTSNPHNVTKAQIGLGNVTNVSTNNQTPTYTQSTTLTNIVSGEKLSVSMGKIQKAIADLMDHIGDTSNPHKVTAAQTKALPITGGTLTGNLFGPAYYEAVDSDTELTISAFTIPKLTCGTAMAARQLAASQTGCSWYVAIGQLPPGLTLSSTGMISGTPSKGGTYYVLVAAKKGNLVGTRSVTIECVEPILTITFNAQGGTCGEASRSIERNSIIRDLLPIPTNGDMVFGGWFTAAVGGLPIDENYTVTKSITLYARWGANATVAFSDPTTEFNIQYEGDRTNYANNPYTLYGFRGSATSVDPNLVFQTGIQSTDGTANITATNRSVTLYLKISNAGEAGYFKVGFDCDSYVVGDNNDRIRITRLTNGLQLGTSLKVTTELDHTAWAGQYNTRTEHRLDNMAVGEVTEDLDSGYAFTMNDIFINSSSYAIITVTYEKI